MNLFEKNNGKLFPEVEKKSLDVAQEKIEKLKELFPNIVSDGKIDWNTLKVMLGENITEEEERYRFTWVGKNKAIQEPNIPTTSTLRPDKDSSKNWDTTENLYIEGDNLEVLKILQNSYNGKIKMIYIDPPYNTGSDFIYKDDFTLTMEEVEKQEGLRDKKGATKTVDRLTKNTKDSAKYHTNWLNMMYPRLSIARDLLTDDGVIFISIDDNEVHNLKKICDEIFGEDNFVNIVSAKMKNIAGASGGGEDKRLKKNIEYILIYVKNYNEFQIFNKVYSKTEISELLEYYRTENISWKYTSVIVEKGKKEYFGKTVDGDGNDIKIYKRINPVFASISQLMKEERLSEKEIYYKYFDKIFTTAMPQSSIRSRVYETVIEKEMLNKDSLYSIEYIPKTGKNKGKIYEQFYKGEKLRLFAWFKDVALKENNEVYKLDMQGTLWDGINLNNLSKEGNINFDNGKKPLDLISKILSMVSLESKDIILDFFSGSATTAHSIIKLNAEDGGDRRFIMIQLPENLDKSIETADAETKKEIKTTIEFLDEINKPHLLSEIGKERIRRAGEKILEDNKDKDLSSLDIGFKTFKVDSSNFNEWDISYEAMVKAVKDSAEGKYTTYKQDRSELDLVYEIMLKEGLQLTEEVEEIDFEGVTIYKIANGVIYIFLGKLTKEIVDKIIEMKKEVQELFGLDNPTVILNETYLDSEIKANAKENFISNGIVNIKTL